jgi:hypothetical protein
MRHQFIFYIAAALLLCKVTVTGGKLNNQYWTSTSDSFNLELNSTRIFFIDPVNSSNNAGYWYHLSTMAGVNTLVLSPCAPGLPVSKTIALCNNLDRPCAWHNVDLYFRSHFVHWANGTRFRKLMPASSRWRTATVVHYQSRCGAAHNICCSN